MNWLKDTTQAYRRGYVEGQDGQQDMYLLKTGCNNITEIAEYNRGFEDGKKSVEESTDS